MNLLFFQYGDYAEAYFRFKRGGRETYRDQRLSVDFVASLRKAYNTTTISIGGAEHDISLEPDLRSIGLPMPYDRRRLLEILHKLKPDLVVCRTPNYDVIKWAADTDTVTLLSFADFFSNKRPGAFIHHLRLRATLTRKTFPCIANHSLNASLSVSKALFFPQSRIVPWDLDRLPVSDEIKKKVSDNGNLHGFYAGALSEEKGVNDCLEAVASLLRQGININFDFAGPGNLEIWRNRAEALGIKDKAHFLGLIPNDEVRKQMRSRDFVVVPSQHRYAEGLPNTLCEALAARTPLIASDHPAFADRLQDGKSCLLFKAGDPVSLSKQIVRLVSNPDLYEMLSRNSAAAHESLYIGMKWQDLIGAFLSDPYNKSNWVETNSLARLESLKRGAELSSNI
jgi:glycosyltransferase involved in cell wall biosynthesis